MISNYSTIAPLMKGGKIKALAVTSASAASRRFPICRRSRRVAPGFAVAIWVGVFAPAGTPPRDRRPPQSGDQRDLPRRRNWRRCSSPMARCRKRSAPPTFAARVKDELGQWKQIATEHKIVAE